MNFSMKNCPERFMVGVFTTHHSKVRRASPTGFFLAALVALVVLDYCRYQPVKFRKIHNIDPTSTKKPRRRLGEAMTCAARNIGSCVYLTRLASARHDDAGNDDRARAGRPITG